MARDAGREYLRKTLADKYEVKTATIGPAPGDTKEMRVLGRVVRYSDQGDGIRRISNSWLIRSACLAPTP